MPNQITIEQMQQIIGRLTMNYELQIAQLENYIKELKQAQEVPQDIPQASEA